PLAAAMMLPLSSRSDLFMSSVHVPEPLADDGRRGTYQGKGSSLVWALGLVPIGLVVVLVASGTFVRDVHPLVNLRGEWRVHEGNEPGLAGPEVRDDTWPTIRFPGGFSAQGFRSQDCWLRRRFSASEFQGATALVVIEGARSGTFDVFVNGRLV